MKKTYTVTVRFGAEVRTVKKNNVADVVKILEVVDDLGGSVLEVEFEELP